MGGQMNEVNTKLNSIEVVVEAKVRVELGNDVEVGVSLLFRVDGWVDGWLRKKRNYCFT